MKLTRGQTMSCDAIPDPIDLFACCTNRDVFRRPSHGSKSFATWVNWSGNQMLWIWFTRYCSAFFRNSTTSRYQWIEWLPPFVTVLLSLLLTPSSAKPKFSFSVCAFLYLFSLAYCENGRADFRVVASSFLNREKKLHLKLFDFLFTHQYIKFCAYLSATSLKSGSSSCRDANSM